MTEAEKEKITEFLRENFIIMPFDEYRAERAAEIRRKTPSLKLPDAAIAAVALETKSPLATHNVRDFRKILGLTLTAV